MGALLTVRGLRATGLMPFFASLSATEGEPRFFMAPLRVIGFPCISLSVIVAAVAWSGSRAPFAWIFRIRLLGWIGRISYGLYLYHFPIFRSAGIWGVDSPLPEPVRTAAVLALCFAVASASYWILERPLLRFGARFRGTAPTAGAEAIRPSKTRLALSVGAAALLVASMFVIFRGGDTALVNGAADSFGRPMDVESALSLIHI